MKRWKLNLQMVYNFSEVLFVLFYGNMLPFTVSPWKSWIISPKEDCCSNWRFLWVLRQKEMNLRPSYIISGTSIPFIPTHKKKLWEEMTKQKQNITIEFPLDKTKQAKKKFECWWLPLMKWKYPKWGHKHEIDRKGNKLEKLDSITV